MDSDRRSERGCKRGCDWGERQWERRCAPDEVLMRRQALELHVRPRSCGGCRHVLASPLGGPEVACSKRNRPARSRIEDTRRCDLYDHNITL
jgi:LSD1 subclass zinc finger protein